MQTEIKEELYDISPFMCDLLEQHAMKSLKVPNAYFEQLADTVISKANDTSLANPDARADKKIPEQYSVKTVRTSAIVFRPLHAVAATFLLVLGSWWAYHLFSTTKVTSGNGAYSKIQKSDLRAFIYENIEDYDENILVENGDINDTDLNTHPFNLQNTKADKELKKYLHDNFATPNDEDL